MTTVEYLLTEETNRPGELARGMVREPASPFFSHQELVFRMARLLHDHVDPRNLGRVAIAPLDVVLDAEAALVVQPDVLFVSTPRLAIIQNQVWGAPDLVVEVLSASTDRHDRIEKVGWYRQYGVRECWLIDLHAEAILVLDFSGATPQQRLSRGRDIARSTILPEFQTTPMAVFA